MMSNDNVRDIIAWELPVPVVGTCRVCGHWNELENGVCESCIEEVIKLVEDGEQVSELYGELI